MIFDKSVNTHWPLSHRWFRANGVNKLVPWHFFEEINGVAANAQFKLDRTDLREVRTLATRQDCDDFAGLLVADGVITEHVSYFHPSFAGKRNDDMTNREFDDLWTFLTEVAIADGRVWCSEEDPSEIS